MSEIKNPDGYHRVGLAFFIIITNKVGCFLGLETYQDLDQKPQALGRDWGAGVKAPRAENVRFWLDG